MAHCVKVTLGDHQDVPSYEQLLALIDVQLNLFKDVVIGYVVQQVVLAKAMGRGKDKSWGSQIPQLTVATAKKRTGRLF
jgi:hypothetical protein